MEEVLLSVKEVAEIKGCTEQYIRKLISGKKIRCAEVSGSVGGRSGRAYKIPLSELPAPLQVKYRRTRLEQMTISEVKEDGKKVAKLGALTEEERAEAAEWKALLRERQIFRDSNICKVDADLEFVARYNREHPEEVPLTAGILYRKQQSYDEKGDAGLLDLRGKHGNQRRKLTKEVRDVFEYFYLGGDKKRGSRLSVAFCEHLTRLEFQARLKENRIKAMPVIPSRDTFEREARAIPYPLKCFYRNGDKSFRDECEPFIQREYEGMNSNEIWVCDNYTIDLMVCEDGKAQRVYLTLFLDVRSRKAMGWCVTDKPCADATIYAMGEGIRKYGIFDMFYTDNGREFTVRDVGGNGFRRRRTPKEGEETIEQPTILKELGIGFTTALPMNSRAKHIERAFRTIKEQFCKLFESYTGGTIIERPDKLKIVVKDPKHMKTVAELKELIGTYLDGWYNKQPHSGEGMGGKSPDEVYYVLCQRTATEDQLRLMNPLTVGKNGAKFRLYGEELVYSSKDLWFNYFGKKVFVRYNPGDLNAVFIYDADGKFVCESALDTKLGYNANKDEIEKKQREKRGYRKTLIEYKKLQEIETHDELELIISEAMTNISLGGNQVSGITSINQIEGAGYSELKKVLGGFDFLGVHYDAEELPDYNGGIRRLESAVYGEGY